MRTVCPSCQAAYDVPEAVLAAGRTLRCARCATDFAARAEPAAAPEPVRAALAMAKPLASPPMAQNLPFMNPLPNGRRPGDAVFGAKLPGAARPWGMPAPVMAGWVVSFVVLAALAWAFVAWRLPIMRAWPASARLYALMRLV